MLTEADRAVGREDRVGQVAVVRLDDGQLADALGERGIGRDTLRHLTHVVHLRLPPARLLSLDIKRFETINETSGFLNAISPEDRNRWYREARASLEQAALSEGALQKAEAHARELFTELAGRWGYGLDFEVAPSPAQGERALPVGPAQ